MHLLPVLSDSLIDDCRSALCEEEESSLLLRLHRRLT